MRPTNIFTVRSYPIFNTPDHEDFSKILGAIHGRCREIQVSYSLNYSEGQDAWYGEINSAAIGESYCSKDRSLSIVLECMMEHLDLVFSRPEGYRDIPINNGVQYIPAALSPNRFPGLHFVPPYGDDNFVKLTFEERSFLYLGGVCAGIKVEDEENLPSHLIDTFVAMENSRIPTHREKSIVFKMEVRKPAEGQCSPVPDISDWSVKDTYPSGKL